MAFPKPRVTVVSSHQCSGTSHHNVTYVRSPRAPSLGSDLLWQLGAVLTILSPMFERIGVAERARIRKFECTERHLSEFKSTQWRAKFDVAQFVASSRDLHTSGSLIGESGSNVTLVSTM